MRTFAGKNCQFCLTEYKTRFLTGFMLNYSKEKKLNIFEKVWKKYINPKEKKLNIFEKVWKKYINPKYKPLIWVETNLGYFADVDYLKYLKFVEATEKQKVVMVEQMIKSWEKLMVYRQAEKDALNKTKKFIS